MLLQEKFFNGDPWRLLVVCIMLNKTNGRTAEPILQALFKAWPTARAMSDANPEIVHLLVQDLGFGNKRTEYLIDLARSWWILDSVGYDYKKVNPMQFKGCGHYANEAWDMFVIGLRNFTPVDKELRRRMEELNAKTGS